MTSKLVTFVESARSGWHIERSRPSYESKTRCGATFVARNVSQMPAVADFPGALCSACIAEAAR